MSVPAVAPPYLDPDADALLAAMPAPRRALFLDRDGVVNVDREYVHTAARTEWVPGVFDLVADARRRGYVAIVVTNQAGIGRGYYDVADFLAHTAWVHREFRRRGAPLLATYWCPHHPTAGHGAYRVDCQCRKPKAGMLAAAIDRFGIDANRSLLLGDNESDLAAAAAAGVPSRLVAPADWGAALAQALSTMQSRPGSEGTHPPVPGDPE